MFKIILAVIIVLLSTTGYGQEEDANYKMAVEKLKNRYNAGEYQSLYYMFSAEMKTTLPP